MKWVAWHTARSQVFGLACALALLIPHGATAEDTTSDQSFIWTVPAFAPAFITDGDKLDGYAADTQNWFAAQLPQYHHSVLHVPLARLLAEMKSGEGALRCSTTLIPTPERRTYIAFAKTILLHLPISVVIQAADEERFAPYLNAQGHIELDKLLADEQLSTAVRIGRAYGTHVDEHLNRYRHATHVMQVADDTKFLRMLDLDRIDWTLYFPSEAEYYRRQKTPDLEIKALPIAGNTTLLEATIGCAKTPVGKKAIAKINSIIDQNPTMPWTEFYAEWLGPSDREWFYAARDQYIHSEHFETRLEYSPSSAQ
ncbi:TIGR02285 family protein [Thalassospira sp. HF15]|uniref:TIGR02285 family protein n=1 Tax=Thalassospira sp. HF15 TaxID=2722755 RepID=UPI001431B654|nr:TIGR02285 family protein [Thalassospira sp. HF15]NIY76877.1 TIGR02285 family protein [Thalassospira sp. HF15]